MIGHATATAAGLDPERVRFAVADAADLPHADASVDLVVSTLSFHHWADRAAGLREVVRVLRPGGRAWIYDVRGALRHAEPVARQVSATAHFERPPVPGR